MVNSECQISGPDRKFPYTRVHKFPSRTLDQSRSILISTTSLSSFGGMYGTHDSVTLFSFARTTLQVDEIELPANLLDYF